eukprot:6185835-Pleurochrysis_carterae.AAC.1
MRTRKASNAAPTRRRAGAHARRRRSTCVQNVRVGTRKQADAHTSALTLACTLREITRKPHAATYACKAARARTSQYLHDSERTYKYDLLDTRACASTHAHANARPLARMHT